MIKQTTIKDEETLEDLSLLNEVLQATEAKKEIDKSSVISNLRYDKLLEIHNALLEDRKRLEKDAEELNRYRLTPPNGKIL